MLQGEKSELGSELAEERKNVKVKVVEVRDETLLLELEMYKRQCRDLIQERAIMQSLRGEKVLESSYQVVQSELAQST